ncbi:hypothetical protein HPB50_027815 [Hyalomma asiaticum]|nr:hypothetical protein HPB50_027815 [Hyalomma asiaticum]
MEGCSSSERGWLDNNADGALQNALPWAWAEQGENAPMDLTSANNHASFSQLEAAGFLRSVIAAVAESLLQKFNCVSREATTAAQPSRIRPQVVPDILKLSHNCK